MTSPPSPSLPLRPTSAGERIHALDAMRGVAILGVLVAYTVWSLGNPPRATWSAADRLVERLMGLFVDNKFLTMFACLFGVGVAQQWRRWESAGHDPVPLHVRRMTCLLVIGVLHGAFVRNGDILAPYALLGFVLLALRRLPAWALAIAAAILVVTPYAIDAAMEARGWTWPPRPGDVAGGYLAQNLAWFRYWYLTNPFLSWPRVLAVMIAGMWLGRAGAIERLAASRGRAFGAFAVALPLAIAIRLAFDTVETPWTAAPTFWRAVALNFLYYASAWPLAATYIALIALASQFDWPARLLAPFRTLGRMAFTNYLLQGLLIVPLCLAFGLFDRVTPTRGVWIALGVAIVQLAFSAWRLSRRPMGPFERLWRLATYGSRNLSPQPAALGAAL